MQSPPAILENHSSHLYDTCILRSALFVKVVLKVDFQSNCVHNPMKIGTQSRKSPDNGYDVILR